MERDVLTSYDVTMMTQWKYVGITAFPTTSIICCRPHFDVKSNQFTTALYIYIYIYIYVYKYIYISLRNYNFDKTNAVDHQKSIICHQKVTVCKPSNESLFGMKNDYISRQMNTCMQYVRFLLEYASNARQCIKTIKPGFTGVPSWSFQLSRHHRAKIVANPIFDSDDSVHICAMF